MEDLFISETKYTPEIHFTRSPAVLSIRGRSYPEDTSRFYEPVFSWLEEFLESESTNSTTITVNVEMIYFNSSSSKVFMDFFDILDEASARGKKISVNWIYSREVEDALEFGEEYKEDLQHVPFNIIRKAESD